MVFGRINYMAKISKRKGGPGRFDGPSRKKVGWKLFLLSSRGRDGDYTSAGSAET